MERLSVLGLRTRIVIALAVVMAFFIIVTELSISRLVHLTLSHPAVTAEGASSLEDLTKTTERDLIRLRRLVIFYMITGAVIALVLGSFAVTRLVIRPLLRITEAVEDVARGKLETEVPVAGSGELVRLGVAFNQMTATIRQQQADLKNRLEQLERSSDELKEVQERLIQAAKLASVGTLAAGVAHEIGNPLTGVMGLLDALEVEGDPRSKEKYRALMRKEISRIDRIINDLLVYARPAPYDSGVKQSCKFEDVLNHVRALVGAQKLFEKINIHTQTLSRLGCVAIAHDDLTQVLLNLLINAAQAIDGAGNIYIEGQRMDDWRPGFGVVARSATQVSIIDDGPGISTEDRGRIFDPFFSKKESGQGFGLGLAISQSICNRAGGELSVDQEREDGTCFIITLLDA